MPDSQEFQDHSAAPAATQEARGMVGWVAPLALLIAVVGIALALWSIVSSSSGRASDASASGTADGDPKARICNAFDTVSTAVPLQTNNNLGANPVAEAAVSANARLALLGGGIFLENSVGPDAPSDLAGPVREFAAYLQDIGMNALAGKPMNDATQTTLAAQGEQARSQITDLCKK